MTRRRRDSRHTAPVRVAVETHGCRLNQAEGDALAERLRRAGHELVEPERAELYLLNSCTITHQADADARAAVRRLRRRHPEVRVVVTGCYANAEPERLAAMAEVDGVVGNLEKQGRGLVQQLEALVAGPPAGAKLISVERLFRRRPSLSEPQPDPDLGQRSAEPPGEGPGEGPGETPVEAPVEPGRTRPLLKVQDGCDYQCSFCIVPQVRGRSRSVTLPQLRERLQAHVADGRPEVVLTGVHLGLWGRDLAPGRGAPRLPELVAGLLAAVPTARLRLGSVDPHEVGGALVELLARGVDESGAGLCQHLHLPVQSGDDGVLRAMRRAHRVADLERLVPRLRAGAPHIGLGTDVIVGFPGEDEDAFARSYALFERLRLPFAHVFTWSPRAGTAAVDLPNRVPPERAAARSRALRERSARAHREFAASQLGRERAAGGLRRRERRTGDLLGLADNFLKLRIADPQRRLDSHLGRRVRVRVRSQAGGRLCAVLTD